MAANSAMAVTWKIVDGGLKDVSVGPAGVWGVNGADEIFYRTGTFRKPSKLGNGWELVSGEYQYL